MCLFNCSIITHEHRQVSFPGRWEGGDQTTTCTSKSQRPHSSVLLQDGSSLLLSSWASAVFPGILLYCLTELSVLNHSFISGCKLLFSYFYFTVPGFQCSRSASRPKQRMKLRTFSREGARGNSRQQEKSQSHKHSRTCGDPWLSIGTEKCGSKRRDYQRYSFGKTRNNEAK